MTPNRVRFLTVLTAAALIAAACSPASPVAVPTAIASSIAATVTAPTAMAAPTATAGPTTTATIAPVAHKLCQVTDVAGVNDKGFNALTWTGAQAAAQAQGWNAALFESKQSSDMDQNLSTAATSQCGLVIALGAQIGPAAQAAGMAHPGQKFEILDVAYKPDLPNAWHQVYAVEQGAFLAGYLAAAMSKTGKIGTLGAENIPADDDFEIGFQQGMQLYNQRHGAKVVLLGWDNGKRDGTVTLSNLDQGQAKLLGELMLDDGADVIMPVTGQASLGVFAAAKKSGKALVIGVGWDPFDTAPDYQDILLTSVLVHPDRSVQAAAKALADGTFQGGLHVGTLATGEIGLAPFHNSDGRVPQTIKDELKQLAADIASGAIKVDNWSSLEQADFSQALAALPKTADASSGQALTVANGCTTCHMGVPFTRAPGWLPNSSGATPPNEGIATRAQHRFTDPDYTGAATSADGYLLESIIEPNAYVVTGFDNPSQMPPNFGKKLHPQDLADIIAYLDTLK